jgi:hypothetical protein
MHLFMQKMQQRQKFAILLILSAPPGIQIHMRMRAQKPELNATRDKNRIRVPNILMMKMQRVRECESAAMFEQRTTASVTHRHEESYCGKECTDSIILCLFRMSLIL